MTKWEYFRLYAFVKKKEWMIAYNGKNLPYSYINQILEELGKNGWEMICVSNEISSEKGWFQEWTFTYTISEVFYFKRPVP